MFSVPLEYGQLPVVNTFDQTGKVLALKWLSIHLALLSFIDYYLYYMIFSETKPSIDETKIDMTTNLFWITWAIDVKLSGILSTIGGDSYDRSGNRYRFNNRQGGCDHG